MCMQRLLWLFVFGASCACSQTVEGTVIDISTRNGVAGVKVEIVRVRSGLSEMEQRIAAIESEPAYSATTDAHGQFHLALMPGSAYTLMVVVPANLRPPEPEPETGRVLGWARTYYPGVATLEAASKIVLPPGGVLSDVEIRLLALPAHAIRGVLLRP